MTGDKKRGAYAPLFSLLDHYHLLRRRKSVRHDSIEVDTRRDHIPVLIRTIPVDYLVASFLLTIHQGRYLLTEKVVDLDLHRHILRQGIGYLRAGDERVRVVLAE